MTVLLCEYKLLELNNQTSPYGHLSNIESSLRTDKILVHWPPL